ncbi:hypothetical protein pb186bvf_003162 [Paramecium bursaria]
MQNQLIIRINLLYLVQRIRQLNLLLFSSFIGDQEENYQRSFLYLQQNYILWPYFQKICNNLLQFFQINCYRKTECITFKINFNDQSKSFSFFINQCQDDQVDHGDQGYQGYQGYQGNQGDQGDQEDQGDQLKFFQFILIKIPYE